MINAQLMRDDGILIVVPTGKLQSVDFERLRLLADPYIEEHGALNGLLIDAESFPGWEDITGLAAHIRFIGEHHRRIKRVAVVTDLDLLGILPGIADHFAAAEIRSFAYTDRDKALAWLRTGFGHA